MTPSTQGIQISARVPVETVREVERLAREADRTFSAEVRRALRFYVEQSR